MPKARWCVRLAGAALGALFAVAGCARPQAADAPPNIILIVLDTLRADRLGAYGGQRGLTPFLDALAARGTRFANAYATSSWTCPSIASLFTSRYPSQHGVVSYESLLPEGETTLAEALAPRHYDAKGFSANFHIGTQNGYAQGFAAFYTYLGPRKGQPGTKARTDRLGADSLTWLAGRRTAADQRPFLLYMQLMEPHAPYEPPEPFLSRFRRGSGDPPAVTGKQLYYGVLTDAEFALFESLYDGEVAALDAGLAEFFAELQREGLLRDTIVVITADHGEEFREHGLLGHGNTLFEESIRIPLIIVGPGVAAGRTVNEPVRLIDVAPSLLEMAGVPAEPRFEGRSLVPLMREAAPLDWLRAAWSGRTAAPDVYCELPEYQSARDLRRHSQALIRSPMKILVARNPPPLAAALPAGFEPGPEGPLTYDLAADPREQHPQPATASASGRVLHAALDAAGVTLAARANPAPETHVLDDAAKEKMRALGYDVKR